MDPLTQGVFGASWAQSGASRAKLKAAALLGVASGIAPDLDVLIRSSSDPLLFLEFHRQFTHSFTFIPIGALIVATVMHAWSRHQLSFRQSYQFCLLGYASHGLLDACTSYGTQLLWPFSEMRVAWSNVSVVDPLFTLPIIALLLVSIRAARVRYARLAALWAIIYLAFGWLQNQRAAEAAEALAASRGHVATRLETKPALGTALLWKSIYEFDGRYYVDALRPIFRVRVHPGESIAKLDLMAHFPWLDATSQQAIDVERFRRVADDFLALDDRAPNRIVDMRYSMVPNEIDAFWAIQLDAGAARNAHVDFLITRERAPEQLWRLLGMLF